jgi:periplasmic protein TonB
MSYARHPARRDRAKAIAAVVFVHVALGAVLLSGLNVRTIDRAVEQLKAFDIAEEPPPPPIEEPPPKPAESSAPEDEAAPANLKSRPTPIVAPPPRVPAPQPVTTAQVRGPEGLDRTAGAGSTAGPGTGAGGQGSGFGGGGSGGEGYTPVRLIRNLTNRDYRRLAGGRLPAGRASVAIRINPDASISNCRVVGSSGDAVVDAGLCDLVVSRLRFRPALDASGRPVGQDINYTATWRP